MDSWFLGTQLLIISLVVGYSAVLCSEHHFLCVPWPERTWEEWPLLIFNLHR